MSASTLLDVVQLATRYGVSKQAIYHWNHNGTGPKPVRIGRLVRYRLSDVEAWEESNYTGSDQQ